MDEITFTLAGRTLVVPGDHTLPRIRAALPQYGLNLGRIARAIGQSADDAAVIDVGGNVGDSVAIIREQSPARILTIEGHAPYLAYLRRNVAGVTGVEVEAAFVAGVGTAQFRAVDAAAGTARLRAATDGAAGSPQRPLDDILGDHPAFARAKLFKLDTDGMDASIVLASLGYVRRARPVIFLEYDPALATAPQVPASDLWGPLRAAGYRYVLAWENTGFYVGCFDMTDPLTADEVDAAASGWATQRYLDLCLIHADDADIAGRARRAEIAYARATPRYNVPAAPAGGLRGWARLGRVGRSLLRRLVPPEHQP
jgi:FkbM family methyltransferase